MHVDRRHETVRVERGEDVARLVMERGDAPMNTFTPPKIEAMTEAVADLAGEVDCLVLAGEPEFSVGADLRSIDDTPAEMRPTMIDSIAAASNRFIRGLREFPAPVVAAVARVAAGGGLGFVLASDLIAIHGDAVLDTAYARMGLTPDNATSFFLARTVGPYKARELLFDPTPIDAAQAVDLGLANRRLDCAESAFLDAVTDWARSIAEGPTDVYHQTKGLIDASFDGGLDEHLEEERETIKRASRADAFEESLAAFVADRDPSA